MSLDRAGREKTSHLIRHTSAAAPKMFCGRETDHLQIQVTTGTCCTELAVSHQTQKKQVAPSSSCKKTFVATARKQTKAVAGSETSGFAPSASAISKAKLPTHLLACAQPGTLCLQLDSPHRSSCTFPYVWQCNVQLLLAQKSQSPLKALLTGHRYGLLGISTLHSGEHLHGISMG